MSVIRPLPSIMKIEVAIIDLPQTHWAGEGCKFMPGGGTGCSKFLTNTGVSQTAKVSLKGKEVHPL